MNSLATFSSKFWNESCLVIAQMERRGICLDVAYLESRREHALEKIAEAERRLNNWAFDYIRQFDIPMNWNSTKQLGAFLHEFKGYPISPMIGSATAPKKNREKKQSKSQVALDWLASNTKSATDREFLKLLASTSKLRTLAGYMLSWIDAVRADGRLCSSIGPNTDTGRLSSSNCNLQNVPSKNDTLKVRKAFHARPGYVLIVSDYSQLEMYVMAHWLIYLFDDYSLYEDLQSGDAHTGMAFRIWGTELAALGATPENIKEVAKRYRDNAKTVNYAIPYGKTANGLGQQILDENGLAIGTKAAQAILDAYFAASPGLARLFEHWRTEARETGQVTTLLGRTRPLPEANSSDVWRQRAAERKAGNTPVQGSAADIVTAAMLACVGAGPTSSTKPKARELADLGAELLLQVHDELIFEVPLDSAERARTLVQDIMENPFDKPLAVQLVCDTNIGATWYEGK